MESERERANLFHQFFAANSLSIITSEEPRSSSYSDVLCDRPPSPSLLNFPALPAPPSRQQKQNRKRNKDGDILSIAAKEILKQ